MIIPSLLTDNLRIAEERVALAKKMSGWLHIDVLDNSLYKFTSLRPEELQQLDFGDLFLSWHCMTNNPMAIVETDLDIDRLAIHYEMPHCQEQYKELVRHGVNVWIAIDPTTKIDSLNLPPDLNGIMVMGVTPGQSGQSFLPETYDRIHAIREIYPDIALTVDGGVDADNIRELLAVGADNLVMGDAIWGRSDPLYAYQKYQHLSDPIGGMYDSDESRTKSE